MANKSFFEFQISKREISTAIENWWRKTGWFISKCKKKKAHQRVRMRPMGIFGPVNFPPNQGWGSPWTDGGNHLGEFVFQPCWKTPRVFGWSRWPLAFSGPACFCWVFVVQTQEATPQGFSADGCPVGPGSGWIHGERINGEFLPAYKWVMNWDYNLLNIHPNFLPVRDILPCPCGLFRRRPGADDFLILRNGRCHRGRWGVEGGRERWTEQPIRCFFKPSHILAQEFSPT